MVIVIGIIEISPAVIVRNVFVVSSVWRLVAYELLVNDAIRVRNLTKSLEAGYGESADPLVGDDIEKRS
jgi:hypothetical protein